MLSEAMRRGRIGYEENIDKQRTGPKTESWRTLTFRGLIEERSQQQD